MDNNNYERVAENNTQTKPSVTEENPAQGRGQKSTAGRIGRARSHEIDQEAQPEAKDAPGAMEIVQGIIEPRELPKRGYARRLNEMLNDEDLAGAVDVIRQGLKATKQFFSPITKQFVHEPDMKVRMDAAKTVLSYKEGMPVQRQVVVSETFESLREALAAAEHSPEARRLIEAGLLGQRPTAIDK
jgi:hypothetical protein